MTARQSFHQYICQGILPTSGACASLGEHRIPVSVTYPGLLRSLHPGDLRSRAAPIARSTGHLTLRDAGSKLTSVISFVTAMRRLAHMPGSSLYLKLGSVISLGLS